MRRSRQTSRPLKFSLRTWVMAAAAGALVVSTAGVTAAASTPAPAVPLGSCWSPDNGAPELRGLSVPSGAVDVSQRSRRVRVVVDAEDTGGPGAASGMGGGTLGFEDDDGIHKKLPLVRTSTGAWASTFTVPGTSVEELWLSVALWDRAGNRAGWAYNDLYALGYPNSIRFTGRDRPLGIRSLDLSARSVDTRQRSRNVLVTLRLSGRGSAPSGIQLQAKEYGGPHRAAADLRPVPGSPHTFKGRLRIQRWQTSGLWRVTRLRVTPWFWESYDVTTAALRRADAVRKFRVISGPDDNGDPALRRFGLSPRVLDVRVESGRVTARARISDSRSGVAGARLILRHPYRGFETSIPLRRTAGSGQLGTWQATVALDTCEVKAGTWSTAVVVVDRSGNRRTYSARALDAAGHPGSFTLLTNDNQPPGASLVSVDAGTATVHFDEVVNGVTTASVILYVGPEMIDDFTWSAPGPPIAGSWACETELREPADCLTGEVRYATFDRSGPASWDTVQLNPNHVLTLTDLVGNPADGLVGWSDPWSDPPA